VNTVINFRVVQEARQFLTSWATVRFSSGPLLDVVSSCPYTPRNAVVSIQQTSAGGRSTVVCRPSHMQTSCHLHVTYFKTTLCSLRTCLQLQPAHLPENDCVSLLLRQIVDTCLILWE
jgi:hypothetical protein